MKKEEVFGINGLNSESHLMRPKVCITVKIMTNEFIKTQCVNCDKCIFERDCGHHFYPYPTPNDYIPMYCGSITEFGCHGIPLTDLEYCPKVNKDK